MNLADEPLAKTFPIAAVLHLLLIFGVSFVPEINQNTKFAPVLDITLVQTHSDTVPDMVDFIAQANQQASGSSDEKNRPQSPLSSLLPIESSGESPLQSEAGSPDTPLKLTPQILTTKGETFKRVEKMPEQPEENEDVPVADERTATSTALRW